MKTLKSAFGISTLLFITITFIFYVLSIQNTNGTFFYGMDDAYIHLEVAKNLASHGVWGVSATQFTSASSSPLYILCITVFYKMFGEQPLFLFMFNICLIIGFNWYITSYLEKIYNQFAIFIISVLLLFSTSLLFALFIGMDHVLQVAVTIPFVLESIHILFQEKIKQSDLIKIVILAILTTATRYEGLMFVGMIFACAIFFRRWKIAGILLAGLIPMIVFGLYSVLNGGYFVPNTFVKMSGGSFSVLYLIDLFGYQLILSLYTHSQYFIIVLFMIGCLCYNIYGKKELYTEANVLLLIGLLSTLITLQLFIRTEIESRYGIYILCLDIMIISRSAYFIQPVIQQVFCHIDVRNKLIVAQQLSALLLLGCALLPFATHALRSTYTIYYGSQNMYNVHYQAASFLHTYYNSENVLLGDLGVMTYFTNITPYDYNGLGTSEITQLLYEHNFTNDTLAEVIALHNISIAVTYDNINPDIPIPCNWILIGYFYYPTNVLNGADHLNIYAINPAIALELQMNLKSFSYHLSPETSMLYIM